MFTGIVQATGRIVGSQARGGDTRLVIDAGGLPLDDVAAGDSIAVSGVCLTALLPDAGQFTADLSTETLARTTLGALRAGDRVNLEKSLRLADRLGGHVVSGHVDAVARVVGIESDARSQRWRFHLPRELLRYVAVKGSICIDGVSLTVNEVDGATVGVTLIPHTIDVTTFRDKRSGDAVNVEVDLIARYLERLFAERTG